MQCRCVKCTLQYSYCTMHILKYHGFNKINLNSIWLDKTPLLVLRVVSRREVTCRACSNMADEEESDRSVGTTQFDKDSLRHTLTRSKCESHNKTCCAQQIILGQNTLIFRVAQKVSHCQIIKNRIKSYLSPPMRLDFFVTLKYLIKHYTL